MTERRKRHKWKRWIAGWMAVLVLLQGVALEKLYVQAAEPELSQAAEAEPSVEDNDTEVIPEDAALPLPEGGEAQPEEETAAPEVTEEQTEDQTNPSDEMTPPAVSEEAPDTVLPEPEDVLAAEEEQQEPSQPEKPEEELQEPLQPETSQDQPQETEEKSSAGEEGIVLDKMDGDHHMVFSEEAVKGFTFETEYTLLEDGYSAALTFGIRDKGNVPAKWMGANVNFHDRNIRVFQVEGGARDIGTGSIEGILDREKAIHARLQVTKDGALTYEVYNVETPEQKVTITGQIDNYEGGYLGLLTFNSKAEFAHTSFEVLEEPEEEEIKGLTDFANIGEALLEINEEAGTLRLSKTAGDHFAMYNGLASPANAFLLEADVCFTGDNVDGNNSAALVFGASQKDRIPSRWFGANVDTGRSADRDLFRVFGPELGDVWESEGDKGGIDLSKPLHLKLEVEENGAFIYTFGNQGSGTCRISGTVPGWTGGYVGLLTFNSEAVFSHVVFEDRTDVEQNPLDPAESYHTNLSGLAYTGGEWKITENGLYSKEDQAKDSFALFETSGKNFVYVTDMKFETNRGAAGLVFRSSGDLRSKESYAVNVDVVSHKCKMWRWQGNEALQLINEKEIPAADDEIYTLKVVAVDGWILYYVNDQLVASSGDYTLQPGNLGQNTILQEGIFGLLNWNSEVTFQNTYYKELEGAFDPLLKDLYVVSDIGTVEKRPQFVPTEPITIQYVKNNASAVKVCAESVSEDADIKVTDEKGNTYAPGEAIPVETGSNFLTVTSTVTEQEGEQELEAVLTYRINVHRLKPDEVYYQEDYRGQYHYSVREGWANDPNGMVYYKGKYHLFYQFYDDKAWGPMHWAHAVSTDLLHWEDQPIALYPDANGAMFSGCIVVDENNTSGLFSGEEGGLVALITADGNGQRIKLAYSEDEGMSWTKVDEIAADWTADPLNNRDFRDPKVFRWENKWFMVVAGGPLRIYSSDNLRTWKCESAYGDLHTECPDLYPVETEDGQIKWVLSRGGRRYKIGDFRREGGSWKFLPDEAYRTDDGIMNFGHDSYAAMTYYVQDFGTEQEPQIPKIIEINWMNTWENYCNQVAEVNGSDFNGTFNLQLEAGLKKENGTYVLTQTPVEAYKELRLEEQKIEYQRTEAGEDNTLLADFQGDTYEIVSRFYPRGGTRKVGFRLRTGEGQETLVLYDVAEKRLSIDRSNSGIRINDNKFIEVYGQHMEQNEDGSVDLHIYVDRSSVEVFGKGYTVAGAEQIFPSRAGMGAAVLIEGENAEVECTVYPLKSIWRDDTKDPDTEEKPGGDGEQKPGGDNTGDGEQKPGGDNTGDGDQKPGGDNTGDGEQKPGGDNTGDGEQKPGEDNTGDGEQKPGGDNAGDGEQKPDEDKEQKPDKGSGGKKKGSSGRGSSAAAAAPVTIPAAVISAEAAPFVPSSSTTSAGNPASADETENEWSSEETTPLEMQIPKNEASETEEEPKEIIDSENGEVPLAAGTGNESGTGNYAALLMVLILALSAGGVWLFFMAKRQKEEGNE